MMESIWWCILITGFSVTLAATGGDVKDVLNDIYTVRGYNKKIRPVIDQSDLIIIHLNFSLFSIIEFNEQTESLKTTGWFEIAWQDEYFTWDPALYNNIKTVLIPQDDIWKPDILLTNSVMSFNGLGNPYLNAEVNSDGFVFWSPYQILESTCSITITYFPFDEQTCYLNFNTWSYNIYELEVDMLASSIKLTRFSPSATWDLVDTAVMDNNADKSGITFQLKMKRRPRFYVISIIIPVILLSLLNVCSFMLPVTSGERAGYSITVFLSLVVFLTIVSDQLPNNSVHTSLLSVYIMMISALSTTIVMLCLFQLRLHSWNDTPKPVSKFYKRFVSITNCFPCCSIPNRKPVAPIEEDPEKQIEDEPHTVTWLDVINAMDFVFYVASFIYTFTCTIVIGIIAINGL